MIRALSRVILLYYSLDIPIQKSSFCWSSGLLHYTSTIFQRKKGSLYRWYLHFCRLLQRQRDSDWSDSVISWVQDIALVRLKRHTGDFFKLIAKRRFKFSARSANIRIFRIHCVLRRHLLWFMAYLRWISRFRLRFGHGSDCQLIHNEIGLRTVSHLLTVCRCEDEAFAAWQWRTHSINETPSAGWQQRSCEDGEDQNEVLAQATWHLSFDFLVQFILVAPSHGLHGDDQQTIVQL